MPITIGDRSANIGTLERMLETALSEKPDAILLPELWDVGFFPRPIRSYADENGNLAKKTLSNLAKKYNINIIGGSIAECISASIKNTCYVFDRLGNLVASYSKTHLFSPAKEGQTFTPGNNLCTFTLDGVKCGLVICYDLRFPELIRRLALENIDLLLLPAQWPVARLDHWRCLTRARAIENQFYVAACNGSGAFASGIPLAGHSAIIDPWGKRLTESDEKEAILTAEINPAEKEKIRSTINVFADRRPELY